MGCSFVVLLFFDAGGAERCAIVIIIVYHFLWLIFIGFQFKEVSVVERVLYFIMMRGSF